MMTPKKRGAPKLPNKKQRDKKKDVALRRKYERLLYVIKALGGGIWEFDTISGALECNERWHEILGLNYRTQRIKTVEQFKSHIHPDDVDRATKVDAEQLHRLIANDQSYTIEFRIKHQDGSYRLIRSLRQCWQPRIAEFGLSAVSLTSRR